MPGAIISGTIHKYLSSFHIFPDERISLLKNLLNFVMQTSRHDIGRRSKYLRQGRGQTAIGENIPSRITAHDRRQQAEYHPADPAFPDGVRTHRAGLDS